MAVAVSEAVPVSFFDAAPVPLAAPVAVVPASLAEPESGIVSNALLVAVIKAVLVPELGTLTSLAASAANRPSPIPDSTICGAASATCG